MESVAPGFKSPPCSGANRLPAGEAQHQWIAAGLPKFHPHRPMAALRVGPDVGAGVKGFVRHPRQVQLSLLAAALQHEDPMLHIAPDGRDVQPDAITLGRSGGGSWAA